MSEILSGIACCDLSYDATKEKYVLKFNPGRLCGAFIVAGLGFGSTFVVG